MLDVDLTRLPGTCVAILMFLQLAHHRRRRLCVRGFMCIWLSLNCTSQFCCCRCFTGPPCFISPYTLTVYVTVTKHGQRELEGWRVYFGLGLCAERRADCSLWPESETEQMMSFRLMTLAEEISRHPSIDSVTWLLVVT